MVTLPMVSLTFSSGGFKLIFNAGLSQDMLFKNIEKKQNKNILSFIKFNLSLNLFLFKLGHDLIIL